MLNYFEIGQRIRNTRRQQGLSQEELAECVGISTTHMSHIETGNTKLSLSVLVDLANALQTTTDSLIFDMNKQNSAVIDQLTVLLETCSPEEALVIKDTLVSVKTSLKKYYAHNKK